MRASLNKVLAVAVGVTSGAIVINTADAQDCPAQNHLRRGANAFLNSDYSGDVAWLQNGRNGTLYQVLDGCRQIFVPAGTQRLYFTINNVSDLEGTSFVGVQIIKVQEMEQQPRDVSIRRNAGWTREGRDLPAIDDEQLDGVSIDQFMQLHDANPFDDSRLRASADNWWHGQPQNANISSREKPKLWVWHDQEQLFRQNNVQLSNRLYAFSFGHSGVPFDVRIVGTTRLIMRILFPSGEQQIQEIDLRINRQG